ncbi:efflux RND transporter periplasmic adaptor subunit [Pseudoxanthomonas dokdonensis]|uniref:RND transporter n=1 Tax=Pseudoxanthomonas dokdonensis TaxID=344882 RepID=A0A0R0CW15_9GAMM|nr:efflux RND transporter periplasmic adaptor subunit [Pseudoxanthomonas dokdonensis]KRG70206.1 RND transporter [Pseudoxanthomonas dokdonensis]
MLAGVVVLVGCGRDAAVDGGHDKPVPVTTQVIKSREWNDSLKALGTAKAHESVTLTAKVSDIIEGVHFESGQRVVAGQPLVTLKEDAQQAALAQAEATFNEADQLYKRQQELADQQLIARSAIDAQRALRNAAQGRVRQMRSDISDRTIRAPFSGVLGIRQVSPGALTTPTTVIATLDDIESMYVDFQVPEVDLASLQVGDKVVGSTSAWPALKFEGQVETIDARIDAQTRAVTVRAVFANADHKLRPGMLIDVELYQPSRQALVVPEIAVVQVGRESHVYRVKADDTVEQVPVELGVRRDGDVEVREGLASGDRIVVDGVGKLRSGLKIDDGASADAKPGAAVPAARAAAQ